MRPSKRSHQYKLQLGVWRIHQGLKANFAYKFYTDLQEFEGMYKEAVERLRACRFRGARLVVRDGWLWREVRHTR